MLERDGTNSLVPKDDGEVRSLTKSVNGFDQKLIFEL